MNKKGIGLEAIVWIIITVVGGLIILGLVIFGIKPWAEEEIAPTVKCSVSVMQANSVIGRRLLKGWPRLNCPKIPVEIEGKNENEVIKELAGYMFKAANDFGDGKYYSKKLGKYCNKRYHPITFKDKNLKISKEKFYSYLDANRPNKINFWIHDEKESYIYTLKEYSIIFVVDEFNTPGKILEEEAGKVFGVLADPIESLQTGLKFIESDKISELECDHLV